MSKSALHKRCVAAIERFCKKQKWTMLHPVSHVYPRAYVLGRLAPGCLAVSQPTVDAESQLAREKDSPRMWQGHTFHGEVFDPDLHSGDWCTTAYVCTDRGQFHVAIKVVP